MIHAISSYRETLLNVLFEDEANITCVFAQLFIHTNDQYFLIHTSVRSELECEHLGFNNQAAPQLSCFKV